MGLSTWTSSLGRRSIQGSDFEGRTATFFTFRDKGRISVFYHNRDFDGNTVVWHGGRKGFHVVGGGGDAWNGRRMEIWTDWDFYCDGRCPMTRMVKIS